MRWWDAYHALANDYSQRALLMSWAWRACAEYALQARDEFFAANMLCQNSPDSVCSRLDYYGVPFPVDEFRAALGEFQLVR